MVAAAKVLPEDFSGKGSGQEFEEGVVALGACVQVPPVPRGRFEEVVGSGPALIVEVPVADSARVRLLILLLSRGDVFVAFRADMRKVVAVEGVFLSTLLEGLEHCVGAGEEYVFHAPWLQSAAIGLDDGEPSWDGVVGKHGLASGRPERGFVGGVFVGLLSCGGALVV